MFNMENYKYKILDITEPPMLETCLLCNNRMDYPYVITNGNAVYNKEYAEKNNIHSLFVGHVGGSIILFPKDIGFTWVSKESKLQDITRDILEYLQKYSSDIRLDGNDVMLGRNKLFGTMSNGEGPYYEGMFFSFDTDINVVRGICTKPMEKEPVGLSSINVAPEEMADLAEKLAKKYNLKLYGGDE